MKKVLLNFSDQNSDSSSPQQPSTTTTTAPEPSPSYIEQNSYEGPSTQSDSDRE